MTEVFFLRHGIAFDRGEWSGDNDELRPLTEAGIATMRAETVNLVSLGVKLDVIISSPLVRARDTAAIVHARYHEIPLLEDDLLKPGFDHKDLDKLVRRYDQYRSILLVGHEPDFSDVVSDVIGGARLSLKKGGLARVALSSKVKGSNPRGELIWLLTPELLGAAATVSPEA